MQGSGKEPGRVSESAMGPLSLPDVSGYDEMILPGGKVRDA